jgi:hypothetical protein
MQKIDFDELQRDYCVAPTRSKKLGHDWKALYNVLQTRVTARGATEPALFDLRDGSVCERLCTCCGSEFSPVILESSNVSLTPLFDETQGDIDIENARRYQQLEKDWEKSRGRFLMCESCVKLHWRQRRNIRSDRRQQNQNLAKASAVPFTLEELTALKREKAEKIRSMAIAFCQEIKRIIPTRHTYYLHALVWHFPTWIEMLHVDIMDVSGSGIEQVNQETKLLFR